MRRFWYRSMTAVILLWVLVSPASALPRTLIPGGCTIGVKLCPPGLMVTGFEAGSPARAAGLKKGDLIVEVDGETVRTTAALKDCLAEEPIVLTVLRGGKEASFRVTPRSRRLGAYVRDSLAGIGTVTYYDPDTGAFGALGHGVADPQTQELMPVEVGVVVASTVEEVVKGTHGTPGELKGEFDVTDIRGQISANTEQGLFGRLTTPLSGTPLPVAEASQVQPGPAEILCNVSGSTVRAFSVEIQKIYPHAEATGRNLLLQITDEALLTQTGGIVQGMSGSPIIQDGKLVGAVTHVLVNDPTTGYGIFIENMLDAAG